MRNCGLPNIASAALKVTRIYKGGKRIRDVVASPKDVFSKLDYTHEIVSTHRSYVQKMAIQFPGMGEVFFFWI